MSGRMYCGGHGETLPCGTCTRNLAKRNAKADAEARRAAREEAAMGRDLERAYAVIAKAKATGSTS